MTKAISQTLFDLLAIGTRMAMTRFTSEELSWWSDLDGNILGTVIFDRTDKDYGWILLVRDDIGRFRCVDVGHSFRTQRIATAKLKIAISEKSREPNFDGRESQYDEPPTVLDLFSSSSTPDTGLHKYFIDLRDSSAKQPARHVFKAISPWLVSSDPNLVKEFQETQFDQRLWEIYLWAMLRDQGYDVSHQEAPDLIAKSPVFQFSIEATTVAPSTSGALAKHPNPQTPGEVADFLADYMPMKFGSPLTSKLGKVDAAGLHYWEKPDVKDMPFIIAIADFHKQAEADTPASLSYSQSALYVYLYGNRVTTEIVDGKLIVRNEKVANHTYNGKSIPSGFFDLPDSENVSAVIFSNAATISKFNRMGVLAGFAPPNHTYVRIGHTFDPDPNALEGIPFRINVNDPNYEEFWGDELHIYHNPKALKRIPPEAFPDAAHFFYEEGKLTAIDREGRVLSSFTLVLKPQSAEESQSKDSEAI